MDDLYDNEWDMMRAAIVSGDITPTELIEEIALAESDISNVQTQTVEHIKDELIGDFFAASDVYAYHQNTLDFYIHKALNNSACRKIVGLGV